jgi:hypothetical protein
MYNMYGCESIPTQRRLAYSVLRSGTTAGAEGSILSRFPGVAAGCIDCRWVEISSTTSGREVWPLESAETCLDFGETVLNEKKRAIVLPLRKNERMASLLWLDIATSTTSERVVVL